MRQRSCSHPSEPQATAIRGVSFEWGHFWDIHPILRPVAIEISVFSAPTAISAKAAVERREASVPIARDAGTPRWLWRLDVPAKARPGAREDRSTPASLGAPLPLARPRSGKRRGREDKKLRRGWRRKTNGRRSYVLFDNLVGSARLSHGRSGESRESRALRLHRLMRRNTGSRKYKAIEQTFCIAALPSALQ
jgi:hypothetical protein